MIDVNYGTALEQLDRRLNTILPEEYEDCYESVQPVSMGSAGLAFDGDGKVAWNEMWATFCDLAMAGGPPHKGTLLEAASRSEVAANPERYEQVVQEICRGIIMVTDLAVTSAPLPGWVRVECLSETMAGWLTRAIVMENVSVRCAGRAIDLPAGPAYRLEKEVKNVVTAAAKSCHYWLGHMEAPQKRAIADLFATMTQESPLIEPAFSSDEVGTDTAIEEGSSSIAAAIVRDTGLRRSPHRYAGWLGLECPGVAGAVWMARAMLTCNVLSRREGTVLFVPVNPASDRNGDIVARSVALVHRLAVARAVV